MADRRAAANTEASIVADAFYAVVSALLTLWDRWTRVPPIEWIAFCATIATLALVFIARHVEHIRELLEGPTTRCRYCQRLYASPDVDDRTCYRRACRKQYERYRAACHEAEDAVLQRWRHIFYDGTPSDDELARRQEELDEAREAVDRGYGGEPEGQRTDASA